VRETDRSETLSYNSQQSVTVTDNIYTHTHSDTGGTGTHRRRCQSRFQLMTEQHWTTRSVDNPKKPNTHDRYTNQRTQHEHDERNDEHERTFDNEPNKRSRERVL